MSNACSVTLLAPETTGIGGYTDDLYAHLDNPIAVRRIGFDPSSPNPLHFFSVALRAGRTDDDVIHVQHEYGLFGPLALMSWVFFPVLFALARLRGIPVVLTLHEAINGEAVTQPLVGLKRWYIGLLNRMLALADALVFLSSHAEDRFVEGTGASTSRRVRIPHGANIQQTASIPSARAKALFGYEPDDVLIAEPGYISQRKGSHVLAALAERLPEYDFLLAGGPDSNANAREYADRIEANAPSNLQVTGELNDECFHAAFSAAEVVVLPYREVNANGIINRISQSGVFNHCMAHGVPVVAADYPYFRDIESEWGCVEVVAANDTDALADRVGTLLETDEKRRSMTAATKEYARANRFEHVAKRHADLYGSLTDRTQLYTIVD